ncbi:MAG: MFS transporter [Dehalococcoidia bacterium]|nr:MAG: MFS transporter [Dehalococcoidia bacterium]
MTQVQSISQMSTRTKVLVMAGTLLGLFTAAMDQTIVGTAMPRVVAHLGGYEHYSWVFTSFMVVSTTAVPIVGKLTDMYGRKFFFLAGIAVMMLGSALCGTSQSMIQLIVFRAIQGLGAGTIMATAFAIIGDVFPPAQRARWAGLMTSVFAAASVAGPLIGGYITDNLNWRWVFYVNLPMGALALAVFFAVMPSVRAGVRHQLDYWGAAMLILAVVPLLLAFSWANEQYPWLSAQIIGLLAFATLAGLAFAVVEMRTVEPILPPALFRHPIFLVSAGVTFLTAMGMFGGIVYLPLFVQGVIGSSATNSGLVIMPMMLSLAITAAIMGQILGRWGRYRIIALVGLAVMAVGMFLMSGMDVTSTNAIATRNMIVVGIGLGATMPIFVLVVQNALPYRMLGVSTAAIQFFRSVGGTMGVAVMGSLVNSSFSSELTAETSPEVREATPPALLERLQNPQSLLNADLLAELRDAFAGLGENGPVMFNEIMLGTRTALGTAIAEAFLVGMGITLAALVVAVFLKEVPLAKTWAVPEATAGAMPLDRLGQSPVAGSSAATVDPPPTGEDEPLGADDRPPDPSPPADK